MWRKDKWAAHPPLELLPLNHPGTASSSSTTCRLVRPLAALVRIRHTPESLPLASNKEEDKWQILAGSTRPANTRLLPQLFGTESTPPPGDGEFLPRPHWNPNICYRPLHATVVVLQTENAIPGGWILNYEASPTQPPLYSDIAISRAVLVLDRSPSSDITRPRRAGHGPINATAVAAAAVHQEEEGEDEQDGDAASSSSSTLTGATGLLPASPESFLSVHHARPRDISFARRWSRIARKLPGRTDNEIKNYWRTHMRKKAQERKRKASPSSSSSSSSWLTDNSAAPGKPASEDAPGGGQELNCSGTTTALGGIGDDDDDDDDDALNGCYSMDEIWDEISELSFQEREDERVSCPPVPSPVWEHFSYSPWKMEDDEDLGFQAP
ncbi:hypothetical protein BHE74_00007796 [Ensete ventricosum]|nr:hypothetical protein GW17_00017781 [Ensete ventricosum]RWW83688.1 hypothetical protein BHE74_00007796 [Ensete ventricosum]RZS02400.1 hypothetical protein BHM03_00032437 [Ensete ventricosum]